MAEPSAISCNLGDGYHLTAAGVRREKSSDLTADLSLMNGHILFADRGVLNTPDGRTAWAERAATPDPDGPTADRMAGAILEHVYPAALALLQGDDAKRESQADLLVGLVKDFASDVAGDVELFHDAGGNAWVTIRVETHRETWPLRSGRFKGWMARLYHERHGKTPNSQALTDALNVLGGKALFEGPEHPVHLRLAAHDDKIYLDLCNATWGAVEVDAAGWRPVADPPVRFRRTKGMLPLPTPITGGSIGALRRFVNLLGEGHDATWVLVVAWLVAALRPRGPYPLLVVHGEQGSAKSTLSRLARALIDTNKADLRTLPRDERDLMISATNGWVLAFDNLSKLADWQSDALCRLSTGGGFATRELYTDLDETILDAMRPMILNGIEEIAARNDLLDRSIIGYLPTIPKEQRRSEKHLWREFEQARPAILGALLNAVVNGLKNEGTVELTERPRMADFAEAVVAAEPALPWAPGAFLAAYLGNRDEANDLTLDASPVAQAVRAYAELHAAWVGSPTELLKELEAITDEKVRKQKAWPESARTLSNTLRRLAPNLRAAGVDLTFGRSGRRRLVQLEQQGEPPSPPSPPSQPASGSGNPGDDGGDGSAPGDDGHRHQPGPSSQPSSPTSDQDSPNRCGFSDHGDGGDGGDGGKPSHSDGPENPTPDATPANAGTDRNARIEAMAREILGLTPEELVDYRAELMAAPPDDPNVADEVAALLLAEHLNREADR